MEANRPIRTLGFPPSWFILWADYRPRNKAPLPSEGAHRTPLHGKVAQAELMRSWDNYSSMLLWACEANGQIADLCMLIHVCSLAVFSKFWIDLDAFVAMATLVNGYTAIVTGRLRDEVQRLARNTPQAGNPAPATTQATPRPMYNSGPQAPSSMSSHNHGNHVAAPASHGINHEDDPATAVTTSDAFGRKTLSRMKRLLRVGRGASNTSG